MDALDEISAGAFVGSLVGVLVLIAVPIVLLGACSPWAIRLAVPDVEHAGPHRRPALRDLDRGSLVGTMVAALRPDPVHRHPAHLSRLRGRRWRWSPPPGSAGGTSPSRPRWPR